MSEDEVEVIIRCTTVPTLSAAWRFIMERLDQVGSHPDISISPYWPPSDDVTPWGSATPIPSDHTRVFQVTVTGIRKIEKEIAP